MSRGWVRLQAVAVSGSVAEGLMLTALPLVALSITNDPVQVSLVNIVGQAPWLLFSLFAGVLIDRVRRTTVLGVAYVVQAGAALVLAVAGVAGAVSLPLLLVVAFCVTSAQVLGDGTTGALVTDVVPPDRFAAANTRLMLIDRGAVQFVVPPAAGFLVGVGSGAPIAAVAAALLAVVLTRGLPGKVVVRPRSHPLRDIADGLRFLVRTRLLLSITVAVALGSFSASAGMALFALYSLEILHLGTVQYGVLLTCMAAGWVASAFFVHRVVARIGYSWSMRIAQIGMVVTQAMIAVLPPWAAAIGFVVFAQSAIVMLWNVCSQSSRQRFTPAGLLGRVLTSHRALAWGMNPLGALTGGLVASAFGLRAVWVAATAIQIGALTVAWLGLSPRAFADAERVVAERPDDSAAGTADETAADTAGDAVGEPTAGKSR
ncbi:putative MFS family arabinose efflux permease [Saccharothrix tamanrassetensis]|uniref:Putative MFS family arabinose efflux permease n=1 Tax=Saccharothrix tamanrassetensis TaxID=1051531 RepID=A0A841CTF9_9PSEU|nr:MFS transporter [Saccharothrix tamanrassetensis]MBB5959245.1 putative MFS family arabinose efflux permease [Saccharothrix tamanrassetensis]